MEILVTDTTTTSKSFFGSDDFKTHSAYTQEAFMNLRKDLEEIANECDVTINTRSASSTELHFPKKGAAYYGGGAEVIKVVEQIGLYGASLTPVAYV